MEVAELVLDVDDVDVVLRVEVEDVELVEVVVVVVDLCCIESSLPLLWASIGFSRRWCCCCLSCGLCSMSRRWCCGPLSKIQHECLLFTRTLFIRRHKPCGDGARDRNRNCLGARDGIDAHRSHLHTVCSGLGVGVLHFHPV